MYKILKKIYYYIFSLSFQNFSNFNQILHTLRTFERSYILLHNTPIDTLNDTKIYVICNFCKSIVLRMIPIKKMW